MEDCDGVYGTFEQAVAELDIPRVKSVRSVASFKGYLQLGNPEEYDSALRIPVERYYRTYPAKPPTASSFVLRSEPEAGQEEAESSEAAAATQKGSQSGDAGLTTVRTMRTYQVEDKSAPGGKIDIERDDLAKGYEYGRTAVHISETDENITILDTFAGLELMGFIQTDQVCLAEVASVHALTHDYSINVICTCPTQTS